MSFPTLALITDYGHQDGFSGILKGVIYKLMQSADYLTAQNPSPPVIDITHNITPHQIHEAAWILQSAYPVFPQYTIFVCIVDPKVGESQQRPLLLYWPSKKLYFIAPDNGLLTPIIKTAGSELQGYSIENEKLFLRDSQGKVSQTFHGRDIYAPVAAHLANALLHYMSEEFLQKIGPRVATFEALPWPAPERNKQLLEGVIMHCDCFGNLITNIPNQWLEPGKRVEIQLISRTWQTQHFTSYAAGAGETQIFVVPSSGGTLELTLFQKSAQEFLGAQVMDKVALRLI